MAITSVPVSSPAIPATQAPRPQQNANEAQRITEQQSSNKGPVGNITPPPPPKPVVNTNGQTIGTRVNVTA